MSGFRMASSTMDKNCLCVSMAEPCEPEMDERTSTWDPKIA